MRRSLLPEALVLGCAALIAYLIHLAGVRDWPLDSVGVSWPAFLLLPDQSASGRTGLLCYTGEFQPCGPNTTCAGGHDAVLGARLSLGSSRVSAEKTGAILTGPPVATEMASTGACFADSTHLYYIAEQGPTIGPVCLATYEAGFWRRGEKPVVDVRMGDKSWDGDGFASASVVAPSEGDSTWRMWYVGRGPGQPGGIGYATSPDGIQWRKTAGPVFELADGEFAASVSVLRYKRQLRAWYATDRKDSARELYTVTLSEQTGAPNSEPEHVAWQSPRDWHLGLPKEGIPLIDASVAHGWDGPDHLLLFVTTGKPKAINGDSILVAENFAVNGERRPDVFSRQSEPLLRKAEAPPTTRWFDVAALTVLFVGIGFALAIAIRRSPQDVVIPESTIIKQD